MPAQNCVRGPIYPNDDSTPQSRTEYSIPICGAVVYALGLLVAQAAIQLKGIRGQDFVLVTCAAELRLPYRL